MPTYVYGCGNGHEKELTHSMPDDNGAEPCVICHCGLLMHRIPQPFRFYRDPAVVFGEIADRGFEASQKRRAYREKRKKGIIKHAYE